jgi:mRNA interferase MazF
VNVRRSETWLIDFAEPVGREQARRRPAVVVSADALNDSQAAVVIVVPTTTTYRGLPSHVEVEPGLSGLVDVSYAKCEDVKSISEDRLLLRLGRVSDATAFQIGRVLELLLDL